MCRPAGGGNAGMPPLKKEELLPNEVRIYLKKHSLDEVVTTALNRVLKKLPQDPVASVVKDLSSRCTAAPSFDSLRQDCSTGPLHFDIVLSIRGTRVAVHSLDFQDILLPPPAEEPPPQPSAQPTPRKESKAPKESKKGSKEPVGEPVVEAPPLPSIEERARRQRHATRVAAFVENFFAESFKGASVYEVPTFDERCKGLAAAPAAEDCPPVDFTRASAVLLDALLIAAARALDVTCQEFLRRCLCAGGLGPDVPAAPSLCALSDLTIWRSRWPRVAMPLFHGGGPSIITQPSLRCCTALSPFAVGAAEDSPEDCEDCPPFGWLRAVLQAARAAQAEAVKALQADKGTAALVVEGVPFAHPLGLVKTMEMTRQATETAVGGGRNEAAGVLIANADKAWIEEEQVYELKAGDKLDVEKLVDFYAELTEDGWVSMIIQPFRVEDASEGCAMLRERRPALRLVMDFGDDPPPSVKGEAFSSTFRFPDSPAAALTQYAASAEEWNEADGCARCVVLDARTLERMPSALDVVCAIDGVEVLLFDGDVSEVAIERLSARCDDLLRAARRPAPRVTAATPGAGGA